MSSQEPLQIICHSTIIKFSSKFVKEKQAKKFQPTITSFRPKNKQENKKRKRKVESQLFCRFVTGADLLLSLQFFSLFISFLVFLIVIDGPPSLMHVLLFIIEIQGKRKLRARIYHIWKLHIAILLVFRAKSFAVYSRIATTIVVTTTATQLHYSRLDSILLLSCSFLLFFKPIVAVFLP